MPPLRTSAQWIAHYRASAARRDHIPWALGVQLAPAERAAIIGSLQAWQLGETGEGKHLMAAARAHVERHGDPELLEALQLFIAEEQYHGAILGRFLDLAGETRIERDLGNDAFRRLRYLLSSFEIWTTVVLVVETLALIYYRALLRATGDSVLRAICRRILRDEVHHLQMQCEHLAARHRDRTWLARRLTYVAQAILFAGTTAVVWIGHRRALRAGRYGWRVYWRAAWRHMRSHWARMRPERYDFSAAVVASPAAITAAPIRTRKFRHAPRVKRPRKAR